MKVVISSKGQVSFYLGIKVQSVSIKSKVKKEHFNFTRSSEKE